MSHPLIRDLAAEGIPVRLTCGVLGHSRQAYYAWLAPHGSRPCQVRSGLCEKHFSFGVRQRGRDGQPPQSNGGTVRDQIRKTLETVIDVRVHGGDRDGERVRQRSRGVGAWAALRRLPRKAKRELRGSFCIAGVEPERDSYSVLLRSFSVRALGGGGNRSAVEMSVGGSSSSKI